MAADVVCAKIGDVLSLTGELALNPQHASGAAELGKISETEEKKKETLDETKRLKLHGIDPRRADMGW